MKGKLFSAVVLVVILTLVLVVPASAGKPPIFFDFVVTETAAPTAENPAYTPRHSVTLAGYKGYFLFYSITWYTPDGALTVMNMKLPIKTATSQTLVIPSSGFTFKAGTCDATDTAHQVTESIQVVDRKGTIVSNSEPWSRSFTCRLSPTTS